MSKTPTSTQGSVFCGDSKRAHPPIDPTVKLPEQVRRAAAQAEDLIGGKEAPEAVTTAQSEINSKGKIPYTSNRIDEVLELWDQGKLKVTDPDFGIIIE